MSHHINLERYPQHVAIIMDGNGRWARQHGLPRLGGHRAGALNGRRVIDVFCEYQVRYLTLYAFSTENWKRPRSEIDGFFKILAGRISQDSQFLNERGVKVRHLGRLDGLPDKLQENANKLIELTKDNTGMVLSIALNYGGRVEILDAVRRFIIQGVPAHDVDETSFSRYLYTSGIPDPDLIIRTGGEMRLSNFLLWQAAYAELYYTPVLWPDFDRAEIEKSLLSYSQRQRRLGGLEPGE